MKNNYLLACIRFILLLPFFSCTSSLTPREQANIEIEKIRNTHHAVGLSVAVVKDNKLIYTGAFGYKNLEDSIPLSTEDIFRIASISKSFTATAIMQLHEAGKFNIDDDVSEALGIPVRNPNYPDIPITYRMLLTHTSTLNDTTGYFTFDVIDPLKTKTYANAYNNYAPGTEYQYCNLAYNMLGALVEIHSGERFDHYIHKHITGPLGLNAGYNVDELNSKYFATIYEYSDGEFKRSDGAYKSRLTELRNYEPGLSTPVFSPTGGMKIAPQDLARHMLVQMNDGVYDEIRILQPESVAAMQTPYEYKGRSFDYGFAIRTTSDLIPGEILKGHTGSAYGLYSAMFFEPEKKFGIIMMTNGYPPQTTNSGFQVIQSDVINTLYNIFIDRKE